MRRHQATQIELLDLPVRVGGHSRLARQVEVAGETDAALQQALQGLLEPRSVLMGTLLVMSWNACSRFVDVGVARYAGEPSER